MQVFKDWVQVDAKKKKKRKTKIDSIETPPTPNLHNITDPLDILKQNGLINQEDYVIKSKSKKKKRQHRAIDEGLASTLSTLKASSDGSAINESESTSRTDEKLRGVHSDSTVIKKKKSKKSKKNKRDSEQDEGIVDEGVPIDKTAQFKKKTASDVAEAATSDKKSKKRKREPEPVISYSDDDIDDDLELKHGQMFNQIQSEIKSKTQSLGNKKFRVVIQNMTQFQSNHLKKSGIPFVERKDTNPEKLKKERRAFARIALKMRTSLSLDDDEKCEDGQLESKN